VTTKFWRFLTGKKCMAEIRFSRFTCKKSTKKIAHLNFKENATSEATQTTFHDLWVSTNLSLLRADFSPFSRVFGVSGGHPWDG